MKAAELFVKCRENEGVRLSADRPLTHGFELEDIHEGFNRLHPAAANCQVLIF